jgi:hypothetical protein
VFIIRDLVILKALVQNVLIGISILAKDTGKEYDTVGGVIYIGIVLCVFPEALN